MILLAVDPGRWAGWARFEDGVLCAYGVTDDVGTIKVYGDELVVEIPQVYPVSKGDPNDLIGVARLAGRVEQMAHDSGMKVRAPKPREWKGSTPKPIHNVRVLATLRADVARAVLAIPATKRHNVLDAIGLGKWALGMGV